MWGFPGGSGVKNMPDNEGDMVLIPGTRRSLGEKKKMATHSNTLVWETPWAVELGGLQFMGLQRVGHSLSQLVKNPPA